METQVSGYIIIWHEAESLSPREIADLADVQFAVTKNPEGNRYNRSKHEITIHAVQTAVKDTVSLCFFFFFFLEGSTTFTSTTAHDPLRISHHLEVKIQCETFLSA